MGLAKAGGVVTSIAVAVILAACSTAPTVGMAGQPSSSVGGLISAQYPVCAQQGTDLATYLDTGQPTSDDPTVGDERQQVLSMSGEQRDLYIRQQADSLIEQCDQQQTRGAAAAAAQARAQAEQEAAAAAATKAQEEAQAATPACRAVGGNVAWDGGTLSCGNVAYVGSDGATYYASATMNPSSGTFAGPMNTAGTGATQQQSASYNGSWNNTLQACLLH